MTSKAEAKIIATELRKWPKKRLNRLIRVLQAGAIRRYKEAQKRAKGA